MRVCGRKEGLKHMRETLEGRNGKTASANAAYSCNTSLCSALNSFLNKDILRFVVLSLSIFLGSQYVV